MLNSWKKRPDIYRWNIKGLTKRRAELPDILKRFDSIREHGDGLIMAGVVRVGEGMSSMC